MTNKQMNLVLSLRVKLMRYGYPNIFIVSNEELTAAEESIIEWKLKAGLDPILLCGENGLYFKGCELVLEVKES